MYQQLPFCPFTAEHTVRAQIDGETVVEMLTFDESQFDSNASKFDYLSAEVDELVEVAAKLDGALPSGAGCAH